MKRLVTPLTLLVVGSYAVIVAGLFTLGICLHIYIKFKLPAIHPPPLGQGLGVFLFHIILAIVCFNYRRKLIRKRRTGAEPQGFEVKNVATPAEQ